MIKLNTLIIFLTLIFFSSCGLQDQPIDNDVFSITNLEGSCKLDTNKLKEIFKDDVSSEIECLKNSLNQYTKYVLRSQPDFIQKNELAQFVTKFFPDNGSDTAKSLDLLFEFNSLFQNDPEGKISITKLPNIFKILHLVNTNGKIIKNIYSQINNQNYKIFLPRLKNEIDNFMLQFYNFTNSYSSYQINLNKIFNLLKINKKIKKYLFLKPLLLGGTNEVLKLNETHYLLNNITSIVDSFFSLYYQMKDFDNTVNVNREEVLKTYLKSIKTLKNIIRPQSSNPNIIKISKLFAIIDEFIKESKTDFNIDLPKVAPAVIRIKSKLLNSPNDFFTYKDLTTLIEWGIDLTSTLYFNTVTFSHFNSELKKETAVTHLEYTFLEKYKNLSSKNLKVYWVKFLYIIHQYKYFSDNNEYYYYDLKFHRSIVGLNKVSLFRFLISKAISGYGEYTSKNTQEISKLSVGDFFYDGEELIRELGMWPSNFDKLVDKIVMGSDLFQHNSDGNTLSNVDELTEFVTTLMNAAKIKNKLENKLLKYCSPIKDGDELIRYDLSCYRKHFFKILFKEMKMKTYFPRLYSFYKSNSKDHLNNYLYNLEIYSRDNPNQEQALSSDELMRLVNAISNIESAFYRFDYNNDTVITFDEMNLTFARFNKFLRNQDPGLFSMPDKFVKNVLIFMLKKMQMPTAGQALWFHVLGKKKDISATRFNISAILRFVTERGYP